MLSFFQKFTQWINKWIGKSVDYDMAYGNQCIDLARQIAKESGNPIWTFSGSAYQWWVTWSPFKWTKWKRVDRVGKNIPMAWDIIFFAPKSNNPYGHVAIVDGWCTPFIINIIEQNSSTWNWSWKWWDAIKRSSIGYDVRGKCVGWYTIG